MAGISAGACRFGATHVVGGQCLISAALDPDGRVLHLSDTHSLSFGERDGSRSARVEAIASVLSGARFEARLSDAILQEMWEKWVFIAASAGITCLMRAAIGEIVVAGAGDLATGLFGERAAIATAQGFPPRSEFLERTRRMLTTAGSPLTASMLRDIERGTQIEADHILGDLLRRGGTNGNAGSLLNMAFRHVKAYEARRARSPAETSKAA